MPIWVNNTQGQTEVDSPWSKQAGHFFCHLYRTHKMCLFSPASEWPSLGGMEKIPHFYKALTKEFSYLILSLRVNFSLKLLISFKNIFVCSRTPQVKGHMSKPNWYNEWKKDRAIGKCSRGKEMHAVGCHHKSWAQQLFQN